MLKTERMARVLVMGTMGALPETVDHLYASRAFHVVDFKKDEAHDIGSPLPGADEASAKLLKMMSVSSSLDLKEEDVPPSEPVPVAKVRAEIDQAIAHLELEISADVHAKKGIEEHLAGRKALLESIRPFEDIGVRVSDLAGLSTVAVLSGRLRSDPRADLAKLTDAFEVFQGREVSVVLVPASLADEASKVLSGHGFSEARLPTIEETPSEAMSRMRAEIDELEAKLATLNDRLDKLKARHAHFISAALEELTIEANKAEAPLRFGTARYTFIIDAWVPERSFDTLRAGLQGIGSGAVDMVRVEHGGDGSPPIQLNNPKAVAPMHMLLEMFSLPSYDEVDPAALMFVTFPIFYGLMLGDIGYGIVILALVLSGALAKLMAKLGMSGGAPGLSRILLYCGITSIVFGFLFDETFGFEIMHHYGIEFEVLGIAFPVVRMETLKPMLVLCVLIGVSHLMLGMFVGLRNVWVQHGAKHAILEKGGWILILGGLTLFSFSAVPKLLSGAGLQFTDPQALFGLALLATGVAMAFAIEGINTILELPGLMGNLLSYSRIYAIGLSSVGIALAFNEYMAIPALEAGGIGIVIGVVVLIAGHALNLGLGIIGPLIQTLRLHYVEFFTKFYKGGGVKFNPLKYNRKHTKEV